MMLITSLPAQRPPRRPVLGNWEKAVASHTCCEQSRTRAVSIAPCPAVLLFADMVCDATTASATITLVHTTTWRSCLLVLAWAAERATTPGSRRQARHVQRSRIRRPGLLRPKQDIALQVRVIQPRDLRTGSWAIDTSCRSRATGVAVLIVHTPALVRYLDMGPSHIRPCGSLLCGAA